MAEVTRNDANNRYEISQENKVVGFAEFQSVGNAVMLPHTAVDEGHEGEGLGSQLVKYALDDIRTQGKQVMPTCPFVAAYIKRHPEYTDLVHPDQRGVFGL